MLVEVKVPVLSESISDAVLMNWRKQVGETIHQDENLIELETDKVVLEITAPHAGVLKEIRKDDGARVKSDEVIALIDTEAVNDQVVEHPAVQNAPAAQVPLGAGRTGTRIAPAARKIMEENNIQIEDLTAFAGGTVITKADVLDYINARKEGVMETQGNIHVMEKSAELVPQMHEWPQGRDSRRVPMTRLRARIAERLKQAQNTAAILSTFNEVDLKPLMDIRKKYKELFEKKHGVRLGIMSFFTVAVIEALKNFPIINASVEGEDIVYHNFYDIGIAVGSSRGLVVPILRDADQMSFAQIESKIKEFGVKAKEASLTMEELTGGTFTITNGGVFGSMLSTPILNPPQSAILGMHATKERPVVVNGEIVVRPMMYIALSYDHRIIDGQDAVQFLVYVKDYLEDPTRILLEV